MNTTNIFIYLIILFLIIYILFKYAQQKEQSAEESIQDYLLIQDHHFVVDINWLDITGYMHRLDGFAQHDLKIHFLQMKVEDIMQTFIYVDLFGYGEIRVWEKEDDLKKK